MSENKRVWAQGNMYNIHVMISAIGVNWFCFMRLELRINFQTIAFSFR